VVAVPSMIIPSSMSHGERDFIRLGVEQGIRNDGRSGSEFRSLQVDVGVLPQCFGSARVTIARNVVGGGGTDITVAIKAEIITPSQESPNQGKIEVNVECNSILFTGMSHSRDVREELNAELSGILRDMLVETVPLSSLTIMPGKFAWRIFVDAMIMHSEGNLLDGLSFAAWAALKTTRLPALKPIRAEAGFDDDFELDSSMEAAVPLSVAQLPISVTFSLIGTGFVVDATREEEGCASSRAAIAVNAQGTLCGVHQSGTIAVPPADLVPLISKAQGIAKGLIDGLNQAVQSSTQQGGAFPDVPDLGSGFLI